MTVRTALFLVFFTTCGFSVWGNQKEDVARMALAAATGQEVVYYIETDPVELDELSYFSSRASTISREAHGSYDENLYVGSPKVLMVESAIENIEFWDNNRTKGRFETWIAKVEYLVVANLYIDQRDNIRNLVKRKRVVVERLKNGFYNSYGSLYDIPRKEYCYFVFVTDPKDMKIKLIGRYPYVGFPDRYIGYIEVETFMKGNRRYPKDMSPDFKNLLKTELKINEH